MSSELHGMHLVVVVQLYLLIEFSFGIDIYLIIFSALKTITALQIRTESDTTRRFITLTRHCFLGMIIWIWKASDFGIYKSVCRRPSDRRLKKCRWNSILRIATTRHSVTIENIIPNAVFAHFYLLNIKVKAVIVPIGNRPCLTTHLAFFILKLEWGVARLAELGYPQPYERLSKSNRPYRI